MAHCPSTYRVGVFHVRTSKYSTWHYNCNGTKIVKVTIRPGFSGTVPIFNDVSQIKKLQFSRDAHLSRFWLHVPDLSRFAHLCSRVFTHRWSKINSDFICKYEKNRWWPGLRHRTSWGNSWRFPGTQVGLPTARGCGARTLWFAPWALVSDCGAQIMVTLRAVRNTQKTNTQTVNRPMSVSIISAVFRVGNPADKTCVKYRSTRFPAVATSDETSSLFMLRFPTRATRAAAWARINDCCWHRYIR